MRAARERARLTQEELALQANYDRAGLSQIENGERDPRLTTVLKLASALGLPLGELLDGVE